MLIQYHYTERKFHLLWQFQWRLLVPQGNLFCIQPTCPHHQKTSFPCNSESPCSFVILPIWSCGTLFLWIHLIVIIFTPKFPQIPYIFRVSHCNFEKFKLETESTVVRINILTFSIGTNLTSFTKLDPCHWLIHYYY